MVFINFNDERLKEKGTFECPRCGSETEFLLLQTWNRTVFFFITVSTELISERVVCESCGCAFPITVVAGMAKPVPSSFETTESASESLVDNFANVVELTEPAVVEIKRRHSEGKFEPSVIVRIEPVPREPNRVTIGFDVPISDEHDWIGESRGIPVVVYRRDASELQGRTVDFQDGAFVVT